MGLFRSLAKRIVGLIHPEIFESTWSALDSNPLWKNAPSERSGPSMGVQICIPAVLANTLLHRQFNLITASVAAAAAPPTHQA